jgi:Uma2 family endonuclease
MPLSRWESLSRAEQRSFGHAFPDFVIEVRSPSDSLAITQEKMAEYLENGVRLGWLIDPRNKRVYVYRPGQPVETLDGPDTVSGEPALSGFVLDLRVIW